MVIDSGAITWRSEAFATHERYDAWSDIINQVYGTWDMAPQPGGDYSAVVTNQQLGAVSVIECVCDPCTGNRAPAHIARDDTEVLAIQLTLGGLEQMRFANQDYTLRAGDIFIWDNTQRMKFQVEEPLHKISVLLPLRRLKNWMPDSWHSISRKISSQSELGKLLGSHLVSLSKTNFTGSPVNEDALSEAVIALLVNALTQPGGDLRSLRQIQLEQIRAFIDRNLADPELSLTAIAKAQNISLRYLHWLFAGTDRTASQYLIQQRLACCRRDLNNPAMAHRTITEIAYAWGFKDPTHFSHRFKEAYLESPRELRAGLRHSHESSSILCQ